MDKVKVNNQVVKMRKHVKRAKLFTINKFTKQLKQLQNKKSNDSQAEKNKRKVERLLEKVKILKKIMPDFVSKKALSKAQNWSTLLTQKNIPLEDQCLALLANDNEVQKEVEKFHAEECQLVEKIPTLFLEWEVKSKMPKSPDKKKKASDIKKQKLDKISKRKKSNFKGATFPNNVAVDKKTSDYKKSMLSENPEPMEGDSNDNDHLNSESSNNSDDSGSEEFFSKAEESKNCFVSKKQVIDNNMRKAQSTEDSLSNVNFSDEEESKGSSTKNIKNSIFPKIKSAKDSATCSQPSIFERLSALANSDTRKLKAKNQLNSNSQNTKAIKVLDLNELQDSELIPIQNSSTDSEELATPQTVLPKKDSFFLNGDEEVESSNDDESNTNNYRVSQPKRKFTRDNKFQRNNFGDKPRRSFNNFKERDFNRNENRVQNKKGEYFNRNENKFQKNMKGDFKFKNIKKFDSQSKGNSHPFKHSNPVKMNDSSNQRENKKSTMNNSFQSKKQSNEKDEKNVNLHPSWEAKNKLKEAAKSGFKGKRIVFD